MLAIAELDDDGAGCAAEAAILARHRRCRRCSCIDAAAAAVLENSGLLPPAPPVPTPRHRCEEEVLLGAFMFC